MGTSGRPPPGTRNNKVRVLQFADLVNHQDFIDNVVRYADPDAVTMLVCTMGPPSNIADPEYGDAGIGRWRLRGGSRWRYPIAAIRLAALLRNHRVDVIHAHHYEPCLVAAAATVLAPRTKLVVGRHYSDAIYLHSAGWRRLAMLTIERFVNWRSCLIVVPSRRIADLLVDRQGVAAAKVVRIPYAFDAAKYGRFHSFGTDDLRSSLGINGSFTIATFGRLYSDKGHRFVLEAMPGLLQAIPNLRYLIVGEGAERPNLERQVRQLGVDEAVIFLGWRRDVTALMAAVDVVVQPSLQEAFSQAMAEALFMARPLVVSDVSGASELVPDRSIGVVVPCHDSAAIARAVIELERDGGLREATAQAGRLHAERQFTVERIVPRYVGAYRQCLDSRY